MGELLAFSAPAPASRPGPEPLWRELVGAELRAARTAAGRTLADVAGEAGISLPYLSEVERGRKEPSSEVLGAVAGALGLRLVDLTAAVTRSLLPDRPRSAPHSAPHSSHRTPSGPLVMAA